jgi:predicted DNA-binding transcriptional regulator AlpA
MAKRVWSPGARTSGGECDTVTNSLLSVQQVAEILGVSSRTVRRLADRGTMPLPVKLNALIRWRSRTGDPATGIHDWITAGCLDCRLHRGQSDDS